MPMYRQPLYNHLKSIGNVAKDQHRQRFFKLYSNLYQSRHHGKQRSIEVEGRIAKEFQDFMLRYKTGMMSIFQPSTFFRPSDPFGSGDARYVAWVRKPKKKLNAFQIGRYMRERILNDEARLRNAQRVQRHSTVRSDW